MRPCKADRVADEPSRSAGGLSRVKRVVESRTLDAGPHAAYDMKRDVVAGIACIMLGLGIVTGAVLGPLVSRVIEFHVSPLARAQLVGGEVASLTLAGPIAIAAGVLWMRGTELGSMLAFAPGLYAAYMYTQYVIGPEYRRYPGNNEYAFPLYAALVAIGWLLAARAWHELGTRQIRVPSAGLRRTVAVVLLLSSLLFAANWIGGIAALLRGRPPAGYAEDPALFWLVRFMDLALVIPAAVAIAAGLLRSASWSMVAAIAFIGFEALLVAAIAGMALVMTIQRDPGASNGFLVATCVLTLVLLAVYAAILAQATRRSPVE